MRSPRTALSRRGAQVIAAVAALSLGAACAAPEQESGSGGGSGSSASGGGSGDTIKIGVNIELSGPAAVQGAAYRNAVELVADRVNEEGVLDGREIELIIRDNKSDPTESLQVTKQMVQNDDVAAIVGGGSSPTTLSMIDFVQSAGVPIVSMGSSDAVVNPPDERDWVFKTPAGTDLVMDKLMAELEQQGLTRVGFISVDNPYGDAGLQAFREAAPQAGLEVVGTEKFQEDDKDHTSIVTKLTAQQPEAIIVWAIPPGAGIVAQNIASSGFDGDVYFDPGAGAELFIEGAGSAAEGALLVHPAVLVANQVEDAPNKEKMTSFYDRYRTEYDEYSGFASYAADALGMIVAAIEEADSADRKAIRDALDTLQYIGVTGAYEMSPQNHGALDPESLVMVTVEDGEWQLVPRD